MDKHLETQKDNSGNKENNGQEGVVVKILLPMSHNTENADIRTYSQMILLPNQGHNVAEIAHRTFSDKIDLNVLPGIICYGTCRDSQGKILTPCQNVKRYCFEAGHIMTGQLTYYRAGEHKNSNGFISQVEQIVTDYCPGNTSSNLKIGLVVDYYTIYRSKKTPAILDKYADRIDNEKPADVPSVIGCSEKFSWFI